MDLFSRIDHVSIAVRDYEKACEFFQTVFGVVPGARGPIGPDDFNWQIFSLGDLTRLEVVAKNEGGGGDFLENFLAKRAGGVHHITLETPDIQGVKEHLDQHGVPYFGYSEAWEVWKELFIHPKDAYGALIQVAEFEPDDYLGDSMRLPKDGPRWSIEAGEAGVDLTIAHPGGGRATIALSREEAKALAEELARALE